MFKNLYSLLLVLVTAGALEAQSIWTDVAESSFPANGERRIQPSQFRAVRLDLAALKPVVEAAPVRFNPSADFGALPVLALPLPDGSTLHFQLEETPVMHPELQAKFPDIHTYTGRGVEDPTARLKCDLTPQGFHGMVTSAHRGDIFIDPAVQGNVEYYVVYNKKDFLPPVTETQPWSCALPAPDAAQEIRHHTPAAPQTSFQGDTQLRRYRLALACTGEYATFHGGTKPLVMAAMVTTMNRVNGVFENDFALTMQIIANNDVLIFLNGATDPYTNNDGGVMLDQNQTTVNNLIGVNNYDIGHVFSTGGGGIAGDIGVVCGTIKAQGVTGSGSPVGDPFDIDYVIHEMGHQFGGNHTFNHCGGYNSQLTATEPGSGTTIMAYAGICGPTDDVQPHSDDYFHGVNIKEIGNYIYTGIGNNCPVKVPTTNHNPDVSAGADYIIPKSTPFALTATGSDIDGDTLTYTWEQIDPGNAGSPPPATAVAGPLFRSFKGTTSPTRVFPRLVDLVNNVNPTWEELPGVARLMNFRVVARDNDWYAGCTDEDDMRITVDATSGPFVVTVPNTNVTWQVGSAQTVTWNVANTTAAPVSCANVKITLSTDGGFTYPIVLAASVPNNGSATVFIPNNPSSNCRVKVESVGNIFFDISNTNFKIEAPTTPIFLMSLSAQNLEVCAGNATSFDVSYQGLLGFSNPVTLSVTGAPAGSVVAISPNPVVPNGSTTVTISGLTPAMAGTYNLTVTANGVSDTRTATVVLKVLPGAPGTVTITSPANGAQGVAATATLQWNADAFADTYVVEVADNPSFSAGSIVATQTVSSNSTSVSGLQNSTVYYWRVKASNQCGEGAFNAMNAFQTGYADCNYTINSTNVPVNIPTTVATVNSNLVINPSKIIADVNASVNINHTWVGDLRVELISPNNETIVLFDQPGVPATDDGCDGNNLSLIFDDEQGLPATVLENQCNPNPPALNGLYQPIGALSTFIGDNQAGTWKLRVADNVAQDGGSITSWGLTFCYFETHGAATLLANNPLNVLEGQSVAISTAELSLQLSNIASEGVFVLLTVPTNGELRLNGTPLQVGDTFTQADINSGAVVYTQDGSSDVADSFLFSATDNNNHAWIYNQTFNINITPNNLTATAAQTAAIACNGAASAEITVTAGGGDGNFTYSINGGGEQNSNVFSNLGPGTYTVVVTGQFGFTVTAGPVVITEPSALSASATALIDDITVTANGGTSPYEYSIDGTIFQQENQFNDLANGTYTLTVKDANGCTTTSEATVLVVNLIANLSVSQVIRCAGNSGELTVSAGGGEAPYQYSLNGGAAQSSNVFGGLSEGVYTVVVTDNQGFTIETNQVELTEPDPITASALVVLNAINVTASGGTGNLEYSIDGTNFQASNIFSGLLNDTYTITIRDENGCKANIQATVNVTPLNGTVQVAPILCFGDQTSLVVEANSGIPPYEYRINGGSFQSSNVFNGLSAGTYAIAIRDASGTLFLVGPFEIGQPDLLGVSATVTLNNAVLVFDGGTAPYTFATDAPNPDLQHLPNGTYSVTATDANGCTATTSFVVDVAPLIFATTATNILCFGGNSGSINIFANGGIPPYEYSIDGNNFQSQSLFSGLTAGLYNCIVRDADGNTNTAPVELTEPSVLNVTATAVASTIIATATGGTPVYSYSLNGGAPQTSGEFGNLAPGTYSVVVSDANGCTNEVTGLIITSGTVEPSEAWGISVSPNPGSGLFVVTASQAPDALQLELFDVLGRKLQSEMLHTAGGNLSHTLHLENLPQGTYLLRFDDGKQWGTVRLSKL